MKYSPEQEPTQEFIDELNKAIKALDSEAYRRLNDANQFALNFHNAYREYLLSSVEQQPEILAKYARLFVAMVAERDQPSQVNIDRVYPIIRRRSYFTSMAMVMEGSARNLGLWFKDLTPHFAIGLAEDRGQVIHLLTVGEVQKLTVNDSDVFDRALKNLQRDQALDFEQMGDNAWLSSHAQPGQDSALILLPDFLNALSVQGTPVVFLTNPNRVFVTGLENATSAFLEEVLVTYKHTSHPISVVPLVYISGAWTEASQINSGHKLLEGGRAIWLVERLEDAKQQRDDLARLSPQIDLPAVISLGLSLKASKSGEQKLVAVTGTQVSSNIGQPFMLTEAIMYALPDKTPQLLWMDSLRATVPDAVFIDSQHEPPVCRFTRNLTDAEILKVQTAQNLVFRTLL